MAESNSQKVVLAIDGSEHSQRALEFYLATIHREGQEVHIVHALEYPYIPAQPYARKDVIAEMFDSVKKEGKKLEEKFKVILDGKQIPYKIHSDFSNPGEFICHTASEIKANMIVLGTRGMGTIRRTILGSVSDYVVHHAHCPVLIARQ